MPLAEPGQTIGLFGGSFNPPHAGHVHVSEMAIRRLELNQIWWLITPGNPLKDHSSLMPLRKRIEICESIVSNPRIRITAFEATLQSSFTAHTLQHVVSRNRRVRFVWVMGADNIGQFDQWKDWKSIASLMPIAVVDRPGSTLSLHSAKAARVLEGFRVDESDASLLAGMKPPAWTFWHGPRNPLSSTTLRREQK